MGSTTKSRNKMIAAINCEALKSSQQIMSVLNN